VAASLQGSTINPQHHSLTQPRGSPIAQSVLPHAQPRPYQMGENAARMAHAHHQRQQEGRQRPHEEVQQRSPASPPERTAVIRRPPAPFPRSAQRYIELLRNMPAESRVNTNYDFVHTLRRSQPEESTVVPHQNVPYEASNDDGSSLDGLGLLLDEIDRND
jgi:hypothetical protein